MAETPTEQAMKAARKLHDIMHGPEREWCRGTPCDFEAIVAQSHDANAAERVAETHANTRGAVAALAAERDVALAKLAKAEARLAASRQRETLWREDAKRYAQNAGY